MAGGRAWALKVCGPLEAGAADIECGDGAAIEVVGAGSIVDARIEGDGDVAGVANISTVDAVDTVNVVDADVVEAFAELELDEWGLELQQNPERISAGLQSAQ